MKWYEILWQLPQYLLGRAYKFFKYGDLTEIGKYKDAIYYVVDGQRGSVTFCSDYIFLSKLASKSSYIVRHEYGHTIQSKYLGWLYLIVIGLPSIIWAFIHSNFMRNKNYHSFYTEKWADKLGGNKVS